MNYIEYNDFRYGYDEKTKEYSIVPKIEVERPSTFWKYYALSSNSVDALTNMYVYATHPYQFNDPFDCNEKMVEFDTWDDIRNLTSGNNEMFEALKQQYPRLEDACEFCRAAYWNILFRKVGLLSLAPKHDNYLMWALYSGKNGFCVEFDVRKFPFRNFGPFPMNYTDANPIPVHIGTDGGYLAMLIQTNVKNKWWENEHEWRMYIENPPGFDMKYFGNEYNMKAFNRGDEHDRKFKYPIEALQSVILGPKFFEKIVKNYLNPDEIDVDCNPDNNALEFQVLDFLAKKTEKSNINIKLACLSDLSHYEFIPILIIK